MKPAFAHACCVNRARRHILIALGLLMATPTAHAHAIVLESIPAVNAGISSADTDFNLRFNSRIDKHRSRLRIAGPDAKPIPLHATDVPAADRLTGHLPTLTPGAYRLEWQVLGADGHITRGYIPFKVAPVPK